MKANNFNHLLADLSFKNIQSVLISEPEAANVDHRNVRHFLVISCCQKKILQCILPSTKKRPSLLLVCCLPASFICIAITYCNKYFPCLCLPQPLFPESISDIFPALTETSDNFPACITFNCSHFICTHHTGAFIVHC